MKCWITNVYVYLQEIQKQEVHHKYSHIQYYNNIVIHSIVVEQEMESWQPANHE